MKIIFLNFIYSDVQLQKFIDERNKQGDIVFVCPALNPTELKEFVDKSLQEDNQKKIAGKEVYIYSPDLVAKDFFNGLSDNFKANSLFNEDVKCRIFNTPHILSSDFWLEERQRFACDKINYFFSSISSHQRLQKKSFHKPLYRQQLYKQRTMDLYSIISGCDIDNESEVQLVTDLACFAKQWGTHIAPVFHKNLKILWIDSEKQFNDNNLDELYYRGEEFNNENPLVKEYLSTFSPAQFKLDADFCIPIDYPFDHFMQLHPFGFDIIVGEAPTSNPLSTKNHYLLSIPSGDKNFLKANLSFIQQFGLIPSPSKMHERILKDLIYLKSLLSSMQSSTQKYFEVTPLSISDLLRSELFAKYERMAQKKNPEYPYLPIFAQSIVNMLRGLQEFHPKNAKEDDVFKQSCGYIMTYLEWTYIYSKDHRRVTNFSEWIIEEILLFLQIAKPYPPGKFGEIMQTTLNDLHKDILKDKQFNFTISLFNSGMRAFFEAFTASIEETPDAQIVITDNGYYEVTKGMKLLKNSAYTDYNKFPETLNCEADIYITNPSTIYQSDPELIYSINLNEFIDQIFKNRQSEKPATVIIDSTLLDKGDEKITVLLNEQSSRLERGLLNIVFFDSLQKYGMLGKDKVQAGFVWAINNKDKFGQFNQRIACPNRQNNHLDAQFICHLMKHGYGQLREAFILSCNNGAILRQHLPSNIPYLAHSDNSPFQYLKYPTPLRPAILEFCFFRGSFGFSQTNMTEINNGENFDIRISAGFEGHGKMVATAQSMAYPVTNFKKILSDFFKLLDLPEYQDTIDQPLPNIFDNIYYLYQPCLRSLFCEKANELIKILKPLSDRNIFCQQDFWTFATNGDLLLYKIKILDFMNLVLRFHAVPMAPEFYGKFILLFSSLKASVIRKINVKLDEMNANIPFIKFKDNVLNLDHDLLFKLSQLLKNEGEDFSYLKKHINRYLINHPYSKIKATPQHFFIIALTLKYMKMDHTKDRMNELLSRIEQSTMEYDFTDESQSLPGVLLVETGENQYRIHVFFNRLDDAKAFAEINGLQFNDVRDYIDAEAKYAKDNSISKLYQRYMVEISIERYVEQISSDPTCFPNHDAYVIFDLLGIDMVSTCSFQAKAH